MPETALPARQMLKRPGQTTVSSAVIDVAWYRGREQHEAEVRQVLEA